MASTLLSIPKYCGARRLGPTIPRSHVRGRWFSAGASMSIAGIGTTGRRRGTGGTRDGGPHDDGDGDGTREARCLGTARAVRGASRSRGAEIEGAVARLEEHDGHGADLELDEVAVVVAHRRREALAHDAVEDTLGRLRSPWQRTAGAASARASRAPSVLELTGPDVRSRAAGRGPSRACAAGAGPRRARRPHARVGVC